MFGVGAELVAKTRGTDVAWTRAVTGFGLLLFGWVPLVFGAFAGWLAAKTDK